MPCSFFPSKPQTTESGDYLQAVMNTVLDGLITIDAHGVIHTFNRAASRIFGYSQEEVTGQNVKMLMPEPYHAEHDGYLHNYLSTGAKKVIGIGREVSGRRKDGSVFPMELGVNEMQLEGARMFVGTVRDISERKQAEKERDLLIDKLMVSNTELERFAYVASHDMQEPLRMVTNFSEIIAKDFGDKLDDEGKGYLKLVVDSGGRLRDMVNDLLEYSRINTDAAQRMFSGANVLEGALANLHILIQEQNVEIIHDTLPPLYGNPVQFMRLIQNLIANGIKYQPPGNQPRIQIRVAEERAHWCITVEDNGLGIEPQYLESIFQPFRRLHTFSEIRGTGLGLSICKKIVENHGGQISVTSTPGKGSVFSLTIAKQNKNS